VTVIAAPRVVVPGQVLPDAEVTVRGGRIGGVRPSARGSAADVVLPDGVLVPGLVDLQINGCFGIDLVDATPAQWEEVAVRLMSTGVTSFAPTFITGPVPALVEALRRAAQAGQRLEGVRGAARSLGAHLEGPFLSERRRGAHDPAFLVDPTPEGVDALLSAAPGTLAVLTMAPERSGALEAIGALTAAGVLVSVGHTDAIAEQVAAAAGAGARMVTHLFNAQRPLHHREPGVVGQALTDPRLTSGLIADLHHVVGAAIEVAFAAAPGRIALVTDAVAAAGMAPGTYELGGQQVVTGTSGPPRRIDGTIAGSGLRLDDAVANIVGLGLSLSTAVDAASRVPADLIGRADLGRITPGAAGDLVWLGDDLRCRAVWQDGELVYGSVE